MERTVTTCYYDSGVYSSFWPYVRVALDARFRPIEWYFEDKIPEGSGILETRQLPSEVVEQIVIAGMIPSSVLAAIEQARKRDA